MPNSAIPKIVTSSIGRGAELQYGPGNNQYARASDVNPIINGVNQISFANASNNAVTQSTSLSTAVTLNATTGIITCSAASGLAGNGTATGFKLNNTSITANSVIVATATCATDGVALIASGTVTAAGVAYIALYNASGTPTGSTNPIKVYFTIL